MESAETGSIGNPALRTAGLCLLSGYFTDLSAGTLSGLYPNSSVYASRFAAAVNRAESEGFMTPADAAVATANAQTGYGAFQQPPLSIP